MRVRPFLYAIACNRFSLETVVSFVSCFIDHALNKFKSFCGDAKMKPLHWKKKNLSQVKFFGNSDETIQMFHMGLLGFFFTTKKKRVYEEHHLQYHRVTEF